MDVKLVSWTNNPMRTIYWAFMNMHNEIPNNLEDLNVSDEELDDFMKVLLKQPHQTVLEFVNLNWYIKGASRAFQQQLTRTREASYSIQSLRIVNCGNFFNEDNFHMPDGVLDHSQEAIDIYISTMEYIQNSYNKLTKIGVKTEDARGVLPLNVHSTITFSIDLRSLYHMLELRMCENTQGEFKDIAMMMKDEIGVKLGNVFSKPIQPICFKTKMCESLVKCDMYDFEQRAKEDVSRWIKG